MVISIKTTCFVIHSRPFSDSRLILQLLTPNYGLISALYRLPSKKYTFRPKPFEPLMAHFKGDNSLKTLTSLEQEGDAIFLKGRRLYCGLYVNELVQRLLRVEDECKELYNNYINVLKSLANYDAYEASLRVFELNLLDYLGYAPDYQYDTYGNPIINCEHEFYQYDASVGFKHITFLTQSSDIFSGQSIYMLNQKDVSLIQKNSVTKRFTRLALKAQLGNKPLKARSLFS